jgi:SAM-dependent methyltransferase
MIWSHTRAYTALDSEASRRGRIDRPEERIAVQRLRAKPRTNGFDAWQTSAVMSCVEDGASAPKTVRRPAPSPIACTAVDIEDPKEVVRRGYDALSLRYEQAYGADTKYGLWISELRQRLPSGGAVLDVGCGCGIPVARDLVGAGHSVTGVDISEVQIRRARQLVPGATFLQADVTAVDFPATCFDAVVALYALIHIPLGEQPGLLERITAWLRPGGLFPATMGYRAWTGIEENWLGGGAAMWWSHADATTNRAWIARAGLMVEREEFVPEGDGGAALFWARRS